MWLEFFRVNLTSVSAAHEVGARLVGPTEAHGASEKNVYLPPAAPASAKGYA